MDDMLESYQFLVTQLVNKSTSPDPPINMENYSSEESFADDSSLSMVQPDHSSQSSTSDLAHQPFGSSLPGVESPVRTIQQQFAQSRPKPPRSSKEHLESHTHVSFTRNQSLLIQEPSFFPLEYPPYPTNDVNFDEWTDYATYCGAGPEPELLNLLSNKNNASLSKKYFTPRSIDDADSENSSSYEKTVTIRPRTHEFGVTTAQPTNSTSLIEES
ncbi:hypothetical protein BCIN_04g00500 [Botrytis cinerea B05.10]|uniref:Uncharacterized protein n=1 Tax=Botryotinia fuckeliana (strain B05.10) TaxID=332648 RepID=A0A384JEI1_BOTFB|nr:hypothetical protein BCIN_04g00500 [Botrytis cinerea B05.10]ATZ48827.1 hypothetical protein BCIN_04g00500 [Botrytis cinerea B05.10]